MLRIVIDSVSENASSAGLEVWVPAIVALLSLGVNILFSVYIAPRVLEKNNYKNRLFDIGVEYLDYLTKVISMTEVDNAATVVRNYSLQIHLMFKTGTAPKEMSETMEQIFSLIKERKNAIAEFDTEKWKENMRNVTRRLRKQLAQYTGRF